MSRCPQSTRWLEQIGSSSSADCAPITGGGTDVRLWSERSERNNAHMRE